MTDDIAVYIQQTENLPEGIRDAINMVFTQLAGRRECAALFRVLPLEDGEDRSREDATHQKTIEDFQYIYDTLETAVAFAAPKKTFPTPLARRSRPQDENKYTILKGLRSNLADGTQVPSEQRRAQPTQVAIIIGTTRLSDYDSNIMSSLKTLASIRRSIRTTWWDYQTRQSDLYDATQISRHAFALSHGVIAELKATCTGSKPLHESVTRLGECLARTGVKSNFDDLCCVRASKILALVLESVVLGHSDSDDVCTRRAELTQRCKDYHSLAHLLCLVTDLLPERAKGQKQVVSVYEQMDPLLLALLELCKSRKIIMESMVVVELYLELYEMTGMPNLRHFKLLLATARTMKKSLTAFDHAVKEHETQPLSEELRSQPGRTCRLIADEVIALGEGAPKLANGDQSSAESLHFLLTRLPLLSGSVYVALSDSFYLDGIQMSQYESRVTAVTHLYRATGFLGRSEAWTQFEDFLDLQGKEPLGLKDVEAEGFDPHDAALELSMALGVSRADFDRNGLDNGGLVGRLPLPYITGADALAQPSAQHSLLHLEPQVAAQDGRATITSPSQSRHDLQALVHNKMRGSQMAAAHPEVYHTLKRKERLSPVQLLDILSDSLAADAQHLKFNHHDLILSCWELLRMIATIHSEQLLVSRELFWGDEAKSKKSNVVDDVLWEAVLLAGLGQVDPTHPGTKGAVLRKVVPALEGFIKRQ
jgi:hypothetical protein